MTQPGSGGLAPAHSADPFGFVRVLEAAWRVFRDECERVPAEEFDPWCQPKAVRGGAWLVFPLVQNHYLQHLDVDVERNQRRCPQSMAVLRSLCGLELAGFSRLLPGAHILPHVDRNAPDIVRCHLGLCVPPNSRWRQGTRSLHVTEGRCALFNGLLEHETANDGSWPRTVLITDVRLPLTVAEADARGLLDR
ncbi:MAG: aspartyl/asparaginyl beta-hydroxylase domain-containing protein [Planctomycetota bacterium]